MQFTVLTSLPTDPYIPAWQTQLSTYRIDQKSFDSGSIRRNDEGTNGGGILPVLHHKNVTQSKGETNLPRGQPYVYNPHYGDRWYNVNERHPQHHYHHSILPVLHQPEFRQTDQSGNNKNHETSHSVAGEQEDDLHLWSSSFDLDAVLISDLVAFQMTTMVWRPPKPTRILTARILVM